MTPSGESGARHETGLLGLGSRVEALFEGRWYAGLLAGLPDQDEEGQGRWAVRCDVDPEGVYTYVVDVRPAAGTDGAGAYERGGGVGAAAAEEAGEVDAGEVVITKAFLADGNEYLMVCDAAGNELGSFDMKRHLDFELQAGPELLQRWLESLSTALLPGLLALLVEAAEARGKRLSEARGRMDDLHAPEDYLFFGLSPDCTNQELERAYRRLSARLHPDKGGDEASFAAMRARFERLRALRARGGAPGGSNAAAGNGESNASGTGQGGGRGSDISWDPRDRASMLQAHEDLRLQLIWISEQTSKVERDIEELQRRQSTRYCLLDGPEAEEVPTALPSLSGPEVAWPAASWGGGGMGSYAAVDGANARHDVGTCVLCLERLPADPRLVVNLCCAEPQCQCLLHLRCFLDPHHDMNDQLRRCMICKRPSNPELIRRAAQARERSLS